MNDAILAIDIGSSSLRAGVFDGRGVKQQLASRAYDDRANRGSDGVFPAMAVAELLRQALYELDLRAVRTVAMSSLWHSLLGLREDGSVSTDVYTWEASAPDAAVGDLIALLDRDAYRARTGSYVHASYPLSALWFLRCRHPEVVTWTNLPAWLATEVLGVHGGWSIDIAAGSGMWNQDDACWDSETCEAIGLDPTALGAMWTEPQSIGQRAEQLGLTHASVLPPFGDGACNSVGTGAVGPRVAALTAGTSGSLRVLLAEQAPKVPDGLWRYQLSDYSAIGGAISNAGNLLEWLRTALDEPDPLAFAAGDPPALDELRARPHLAGERGPGYRRHASGELVGLRLHHSVEDISRAFVLGIFATYRQLTELTVRAVPTIDSFVVSGGVVAVNPIFAQLLADATGRPVSISETEEPTLHGAALRALGSTGAAPSSPPLLPREDWTQRIAAEAD